MAVYSFRTGIFARDIYLYGNQRFTARDGFNGIPLEYHIPVKQYAAKNFTLLETDKALANNWINQQEYDETITLRTPDSPNYAPSM
jgi:hypothetical protein